MFAGDREIYRSSRADSADDLSSAQESGVNVYGVSWRLLVEPDPRLAAEATSALAQVVLTAGLALAVLLTITCT